MKRIISHEKLKSKYALLGKNGLLVGTTLTCLLSSGCNATSHEVTKVSSVAGNHFKLTEKIDQEIHLIDGRNGKEIKKITPSTLGYFRDENVYINEITKIAHQLGKSIDTKMKPARLTTEGAWENGESAYELSENEMINKLKNINIGESTYILPIKEKKPIEKPNNINNLEGNIIGRYETNLGTLTGGRVTNIRLAASTINGVVLGKGDRFSFNTLIGDTTAEKGYQLGKQIVSGKLLDGYGGGVCQASTTLFNAVDQAGLKILERSTHSKGVSYVPNGRDATISYPDIDLVFENTKDFTIKLVMFIGETKLVAEVYAIQQDK